MKQLIRGAFRRFASESSQSVFVLSQAMGGGKTHNMIAQGLLAAYPGIREKVIEKAYQFANVPQVRVVAFSGRESDTQYGIWGSIASQLEKRNLFSDYYSPLAAPGQSAWELGPDICGK